MILNVFRFDGDNFIKTTDSKCIHGYTFGLANYQGMAFTTGSFWRDDCLVVTELYDFESDQWTSGPDYPFAR